MIVLRKILFSLSYTNAYLQQKWPNFLKLSQICFPDWTQKHILVTWHQSDVDFTEISPIGLSQQYRLINLLSTSSEKWPFTPSYCHKRLWCCLISKHQHQFCFKSLARFQSHVANAKEAVALYDGSIIACEHPWSMEKSRLSNLALFHIHWISTGLLTHAHLHPRS